MTAMQVNDYLLEKLGMGEFIGEPDEYGPWRVAQAGILKRMMAYRRVRPDDVLACADYCKAHRIQPETHQELFYHLDDAREWKRDQVVNVSTAAVEAALQRELALSDSQSDMWVSRILRTRAADMGEVLEEWRKARSQT
jgi:hypothetical protein